MDSQLLRKEETGFGEPIDVYKVVAFILIWIAVIIYSVDSIRHARKVFARTGED